MKQIYVNFHISLVINMREKVQLMKDKGMKMHTINTSDTAPITLLRSHHHMQLESSD